MSIVGPNLIWGRAKGLGVGYDLNQLGTSGHFDVREPLNGPSDGRWHIMVFVNSEETPELRLITQVAWDMDDGRQFVRVLNEASWSTWKLIGEGGGGSGGDVTASDVEYDNTVSGIVADNVQSAMDIIEGRLKSVEGSTTEPVAENVEYTNTTSGLAATNVQGAIDELATKPSVSDAEDVDYSNTTSGLAATDVQAAIDELAAKPSVSDAEDVNYSNTASGLTATDVQAAIDEVEGRLEVVENNTTEPVAENVEYTNTTSGLAATDVQAAIDELAAKPSVSDAEDVNYSNTASGLTATDVQAAIDEVKDTTDSLDTRLTAVEGSTTEPVAENVEYTNTTSGLTATDVQAAIDELAAKPSVSDAEDVNYSNTASGLTATDVQAAIDEVEGRLEVVENNTTEPVAENVEYTNTTSGLAATDVQAAIDELAAKPSVSDAEDVNYSNTASGLTATDVQAAIDEVEGRLVAVENVTTVPIASAIEYDNTASELAAENVQAAIDEVVTDTNNVSTRVATLETNPYIPEADEVPYSNTASGMTSTDVQAAIDEVESRLVEVENVTTVPIASAIDYSNTSSGLTATNVQAAIDEVEAHVQDVVDNPYLPEAAEVAFSNTASGLAASTVQGAIDEIVANPVIPSADDIPYSNNVSGLAGDDVQAAIDEIASVQSGNRLTALMPQYIGSVENTVLAGNNITFPDTYFGKPHPNRTVIIVISSSREVGPIEYNEVRIGGVIATLDHSGDLVPTGGQNGYNLAVYRAKPTSEYGAIFIGSSHALHAVRVDVYALNYTVTRATQETAFSAGNTANVALNGTPQHFMLGALAAKVPSAQESTWGNTLTEYSDAYVSRGATSSWQFSTAVKPFSARAVTASPVGATCTDATGMVLIGVSYTVSDVMIGAEGVAYGSTTTKTALDGLTTRVGELESNPVIPDAADIDYSNTASGLTATKVQGAIDEVESRVQTLEDATIDADEVVYDNTSSGMTATQAQAAIDELDTRLTDVEGYTTVPQADHIEYSNTASGLTGDDVQAAIDELAARPTAVDDAEDINYANTTSGLTATDVQAAIDEIAARPTVGDAGDVDYSNTTSGLAATDVQAAIDELAAKPSVSDAEDVAYSNTASGLTATDVQAAIDEVEARVEDIEANAGGSEIQAAKAVEYLNGREGAVFLFDKNSFAVIDSLDTKTRGGSATDVLGYTRNSPASYEDNGYLYFVGANEPRITSKGILVERSATNIVSYSTDFTQNSVWVKFNSSLNAGAAIAGPTKELVSKWVEAAGNNPHQLHAFINANRNSWLAISIYAKAGERTNFMITADTAITGSNNARYRFNLTTGVITPVETVANAKYGIIPLADGWFRCYIIIPTKSGAAGTESTAIQFNILNDAGERVYNGNGTSGMYVYGAQAEQHNGLTSLIVTGAAAATRAGDLMTIPMSTLNYKNNVGTILTEFTPQAYSDRNTVLSVNNGTGVNEFSLGYESASQIRVRYFVNNGTYDTLLVNKLDRPSVVATMMWQTNNGLLVLENGDNDAAGFLEVPTSLNTLSIGSAFGGSNPLNGYIKNIVFIPRRIANTEVNDYLISQDKEPLGRIAVLDNRTTNMTLNTSDAGKVIEVNSASAVTVTIPVYSAVPFKGFTRTDIVQTGAGQVSFVAASGVTLRSKDGKLKLAGQYSGATLYRRGTNEWVIIGDLVE